MAGHEKNLLELECQESSFAQKGPKTAQTKSTGARVQPESFMGKIRIKKIFFRLPRPFVCHHEVVILFPSFDSPPSCVVLAYRGQRRPQDAAFART